MRILVFGGTGFVGLNIAAALLVRGHAVTLFDRMGLPAAAETVFAQHADRLAVIRGDTADECVGIDFGEHEYLTVLEFLQCMSNIVINDGGTGLFSQLQVGTLLHGDKYVFVTEASQLGFWSIDQVFSRYRNYEG